MKKQQGVTGVQTPNQSDAYLALQEVKQIFRNSKRETKLPHQGMVLAYPAGPNELRVQYPD
eukprot:5173684-Karenia_brevis.AAC.1